MTWEIDAAHSGVSFSAKHMVVTTVRGTMAIREATIAFDEADPTRSHVSATIDAASIDTRNEMRDNHLRSADFLDVEHHPTIEFRSTGIERDGDGWRIAGDLTIRGETRPVVLEAELHGIQHNLRGGRRAAFSARAKIDREAWGLTWNVALEQGGWLVSRDIAVEIDLVAVQPVTAAEPTTSDAARRAAAA